MIHALIPCVRQMFKAEGRFHADIGYGASIREDGNGFCGLENGDGQSRGYADYYGDGPEIFFPPYRQTRPGWDPVLLEVLS